MTRMNNENNQISRNYMVDLLRVVAMILVISHHFLGHGGVLENVRLFSFNWYFSWFVKTVCYTSVTCFYLISAYYQSKKPQGVRGIVSIWICVEFYSIICYVFSCAIGLISFSPVGLIKALLPLTFRQYGFVNGYILLSILTPFLNKAIRVFDRRTHIRLIIILGVLCSVLPYISFIDPFNMDYGEGCLWIVLLFLVASYIREYPINSEKNWRYVLIFIVTATVTFLSKVLISHITFKVLGEAKYSGAFVGETQILMLISAVALFMFFLSCGKRHDSNTIKSLSRLSQFVFAVFLIHENNNIKFHLWSFLNPGQYANSSIIILIGYWLIIVVGLFAIATVIEMVRKAVNKAFRVDRNITEILTNLYNRI